MDGLTASMAFMGHSVTFRYAVKENCYSPKAIAIDGKALQFTHEDNKYRLGGAVIPINHFLAKLGRQSSIVEIRL
jgi:hypothetical protein